MRRARALEFDRVLARLGQQAGIGPGHQLGAGRAQPGKDPGGGTVRIGQHPGARASQFVERRAQRAGFPRANAVAQVRLEPGAELLGRHEPVDRGIRAQQREGQRQRRARHVAAAQVQ
jgi:hypothetical protein